MYHNILVNLASNQGAIPLYIHSIEYNSSTRTVTSVKFTQVYRFAWLPATANQLEALETYLQSSKLFLPVYTYKECIKPSLERSERIYQDVDRYARIDSLEVLPEFFSIVIGKPD